MPRKPLRDGWNVLQRAPESVLAEIVWRWTFGATTLVLLFLSFHTYFSQIEIGKAEYNTLKALEPFTWIAITVRVLHASVMGVRTMGPVLIPAIAALWIVLATIGRVGTVRALSDGEAQTSWKSSLILNLIRLLMTFAALLAFFGAGAIANRLFNPATQYGLTVLVMLIVLLVLVAIWSVVNWFLSTASIFSARDHAGIGEALTSTADLYSGGVGRVGVWFGLMRAILIIGTTFVSLLMVGAFAQGHSRAPLVGLAAVSLIYFVFADAIYTWRLAVYIGLSEPEAPEPVSEPAPPSLFPVIPEELALNDEPPSTSTDAPLDPATDAAPTPPDTGESPYLQLIRDESKADS